MPERPDLAAMLMPIARALMAMEAPILDDHNLSMWAYTVLNRIADEPVRGQGVLAEEIGADKSRIIDILDELQQRGLIQREADPADRRAKILTITAAGRRLRNKVRTAIQRAEQPLLRQLPAHERAAFLRALGELSARVRRQPFL